MIQTDQSDRIQVQHDARAARKNLPRMVHNQPMIRSATEGFIGAAKNWILNMLSNFPMKWYLEKNHSGIGPNN